MKKFFKKLLFWFLIVLLFIVAYFVYVFNDLTAISKGSPIPEYAETKIAVLVIDIQEGYTGVHARVDTHVKQSEELIKNTNQVITAAHEVGVPVVYIQQQIENKLINWLDGHMAEGTPGIDIDMRVKIVSLTQFKKRKSDAFSSHDMDQFLLNMKINTIVITGIDIAECAYRTSCAALNRGYKVVIVEEAVISKNNELKQEKLAELKSKGAQLVSVDNLNTIFTDQPPLPDQQQP